MTSSPPLVPSQPRFYAGGRATSLALLCTRIAQLPGLSILEETTARTGERRGEARVVIDVRGTGLSGYEIGRRMRRFSGVPLEFCREHRLLVVFDDDEQIAARGERLLFALSHACQRSADAVSPGV